MTGPDNAIPQSAARGAGCKDALRRLLHQPGALLILTAGIFTARWIWVAGIGDFGWTYEAAWRIAHGEIQYRDFISSLPPLANYTLAALLALFGDSLWLFQIHLYLWWYLSLEVGFLIGCRLIENRALLCAAMVFTVVFSNPANSLGHAYNYAATFFGGVQILALLSLLRRECARNWFVLGLIGGIGMFAKQNVGLAVVAAVGVVILLHMFLPARNRPVLWGLLLWPAGLAAGFLPLAAWFSWKAGWNEFALQFFKDAADGKGGIYTILGRALPRIILHPDTPHHRLIEAGASVMLGLALIGVWRRWQSQSGNPSRGKGSQMSIAALALGFFLFSTVALALVSLLHIPAVTGFQEVLRVAHVPTGSSWVIFAFYMASVLALAAAAFARRRTPEQAAPCFVALAILLGTATSSLIYYVFAAPVIIPVLISALRNAAHGRTAALCLFCATGFAMVSFLSPMYSPTFLPLKALPAATPFSGLRSTARIADSVEALYRDVSPAIRGHRTLWLCSGGPHSAFGGLPVRNVASFYQDTYSSRQELPLVREWELHPPEFVVYGKFSPTLGARLFTQQGIDQWLRNGYELVWKDSATGTSLWWRTKH